MNRRADYIIPECYVDTNLIETLVCHAGCNHQKGCNQVTKVMQEKFTDRFAVGIIDDDKRKPSYLNYFTQIASSRHISVYIHSSRPHFIILITPAIDGFILSCARDAGVNLSDYNLSHDIKKFTAQTKDVMSSKDSRFKKLFRDMEDTGEIKLMKSLVSYLVNTTYKASTDGINTIFSSNRPG